MDKKKFERKLKMLLKLGFTITMFAITVFCATADVNAWGFSAFGFAVGSDGVHKQEKVTSENQGSNQVNTESNQSYENQAKNQEQIRNRNTYQYQENNEYEQEIEGEIYQQNDQLDIGEVIEKANSDPWANNVLKEFSGENFCVSTDERIAYFFVNDDGTINWLDSEPDKCLEIKSNEAYANKAWKKVQNREKISAKEFEDNVAMPWKMRMKIAWMGLWKSKKAVS